MLTIRHLVGGVAVLLAGLSAGSPAQVINYSIGGQSTQFSGPDDIAFLYAADAGLFVASSQGNEGPAPGTTGMLAGVPWLTSVGATQD